MATAVGGGDIDEERERERGRHFGGWKKEDIRTLFD